MADITPALIKELRDATGIGIMKCKEALKSTDGDLNAAIEELRKQGLASAEKRMGRQASQGMIAFYSHAGGKIGAMVELNCETDFVARTDDFQKLAKDLCMHVVALMPLYVSRDSVPAEVIEKEKEILKEQVTGKPENVVEKIVEGRLGKYYEENCLLDQPFIHNEDITVDAAVRELISKLGENIQIRRFERWELGK